MPRKEKFRHGDVVQIADDLGPSMDHFTKSKRAIVIGSYRDQYGGNTTDQYTIFVEGQGKTSWYYEHQLTFIEHNPKLLDTWEDQVEARRRDESDIKWIVEHWDGTGSLSSTSILALFNLAGIDTSFNRNGEYICLAYDWCKWFPIFNVLIQCKTIEELRAHANPNVNADPAISEDAENIWKALHENHK